MKNDEACRIEPLQKEVGVGEYMAACVDVAKFVRFCEQCPGYGGIWSCPPFSFSAEAFWRSYQTLLLYGKKIVLPPSLLERTFEKEELEARYRAIFAPVKQGILSELFALEREYPGSMALSAGSCGECDPCARKEGLPCRKPGVMRHSIESLGGDVARTLELYFGETLLWAREGRLPAHFFLLGGLLKP